MVMIVQLLCPERHCILVSAYEEGRSNFIEACNALEEMVGPNGPFKRQCMLCGSRDLRFEEGRTRFKTLIEAAPSLHETMAANVATRRLLDAQGKTLEKMG